MIPSHRPARDPRNPSMRRPPRLMLATDPVVKALADIDHVAPASYEFATPPGEYWPWPTTYHRPAFLKPESAPRPVRRRVPAVVWATIAAAIALATAWLAV